MNVAKTYDMLSHALSILSIPDIYSYSLVLNSIELDIGNRIGDASATAATTIYPIGDFSRSRGKVIHYTFNTKQVMQPGTFLFGKHIQNKYIFSCTLFVYYKCKCNIKKLYQCA